MPWEIYLPYLIAVLIGVVAVPAWDALQDKVSALQGWPPWLTQIVISTVAFTLNWGGQQGAARIDGAAGHQPSGFVLLLTSVLAFLLMLLIKGHKETKKLTNALTRPSHDPGA